MSLLQDFLAPLVVGLTLMGAAGGASAQDNSVTAIDIALEPDATMMQHAEAVNAKLREAYPKGYSLDASHQPHISMLQRYVNTADLDKVYAAVDASLATEKPATWTLEGEKLEVLGVLEGLGLVVIDVKTTPEMIALQQKLIDAVAPFTVKTGTAAAFYTTPEEPDINQPTIDYVANYVPNYSGDKLNAHVTTGVAAEDFTKTFVTEPFESFTFSPSAMSAYQLGNFGTARKKLHAWEFKP